MRLELELLESFTAIVDGGGFSRAGARLHRAQSTISQQLKRLEEQVGAPLLARTTREVALTATGELLLGYARRLLDLHAQATAALGATRLAGAVRIGMAQDLADGGLGELLSHFARLHPGVGLEVRVDANCHLRARMEAGGLELAVVLQEPGAGGEVMDRLKRVWVAAPEFRMPEAGPLPLVLFEAPCVFRNAALNALDGIGMPWRIALTTPSLAGLRAAVRAGFGVSVRTARWLEEDLRVLGAQEGMPPLPGVELSLLTAPGPRSAAAERLAQTVREAFG